MIIVVVVLHVLVSLFLISVILLQAGRGQGLSWGVFGGTPQSILGTKTASFLSRVTTGCAIIFLITCILLNIIETRKSRSLLTAPNKRISQVDFAKIKEALEKAEQAKKSGTTVKTEPTKTESSPLVNQAQTSSPVTTKPLASTTTTTSAAPPAETSKP